MNDTSQIFGHYREAQEPCECVLLRFSSAMLSLQHQWLSNSLTANFLAEYWHTYCNVPQKATLAPLETTREVVGYVVNELLDNAVKYGYASADDATQVTIRMALLPQHIRVYVTNRSHPEKWTILQEYIHILLTEEPDVLYFRQMEENAVSQHHSVSRLGLLSIMHDYHGQLGWKFETPLRGDRKYRLTTMVEIPVS